MIQYESSPSTQFDPGPLSWVMVEIREALGRSRTALFEAGGLEPEDQATALRHAKSHLHQAHGALLMVDVDGVVLMTQLAEEVLERFKAGTLKCSLEHVQVVAALYQAVTEYLEELLDGAPFQPIRLFPFYRAVQELLGAQRIHPADLFFPDLARWPTFAPAAGAGAADYGTLRQRFERALLPYLKSGEAAHAGALRDVVAEVAAAQAEPRARAFWLALHAFAELVAAGLLPAGLYAKQLFGLINLQMRRLAQGAPETPEAVLRDALFFVAAAVPDTLPPLAREVRDAWRLDGLVPADYETRRYGQLDLEALARAKEGLAHARAAWQQIEQADGASAHNGEFGQALALVAAASDKLGLPALGALMRQLAITANQAVVAGRSEELGLEMATALLFAGHGLEQIRHLPDDFAANADTIGARLQALVAGEVPPEPAQWQSGLAQRLQQDDTVVALSLEMKTALRHVEKVLDDYHAHGTADLGALDSVLHQLEGALAVADQEDAMRAARHVRGEIARLAAGGGDPAALEGIARNVGALGFFVDMLAQNAAGARERFAFDAAQGTFRAIPFRKIAGAETIPVLEEEVAPPAPLALPEAPPSGVGGPADAAIEAELLEIFIGEAQEVLAFIVTTLTQPRLDAGTPDNLAMLRRSFHTLKGSGRMVGLNQFADAAGAVEKTMNVWIAEARPVSEALFGLLEWVSAELNEWVAELVAKAISPRSAHAIAEAARRVREGEPFVHARAPQAIETAPAPPYVTDEHAAAEAVPAPAAADEMVFVGRLAVPRPLFDIYTAEADGLLARLREEFPAWRAAPERGVDPDTLQAVHTLTGTSATVGFKPLRELAYALELVLQAQQATAAWPDAAQHDLFDFALERMRQMLDSFVALAMPEEQPELIAALDKLREDLARPPAAGDALGAQLDSMLAAAPVPTPAAAPAPEQPVDELAARLDALFADTYHALLADPPPLPARGTPLPLRPQLATQDDSIDDLFASAFDDAFAEPPLTQAALPQDDDALFSGAVAAAVPAPEPAPGPEAVPEPEPFEPPAAAEAPVQPEDLAAEAAEAEQAAEVEVLALSPGSDALATPVDDELDADLLPVFLEEGADLLPQVGAALRAWQQAPQEVVHAHTLQRVLHTLKGSARMAGAMRLGQHAHEIETHVETMANAGSATPHAFEELLAHYDHALLLFEQLQHPAPQGATVPAPVAQVAQAAAAEGGTQVPLVRVRADILDRLVNQAGEVAIARSRLENEVGVLRTALADFDENLGRLRRQLREVEVQAESQIASRLSIAGEREFDPLEFDRFTRLQELTRMMAESVDDVGSFHDALVRSVDSASDDLVQQARMTRELQRDLMRVRMVPFGSIAERLYRVARQAAKETDKRVNLDIRGGSVEMDRGVLERMAAPFEHLLRNAIVHGIEPRAARVAAGKQETGELLVQVSQQGNEIVLEFSDDGGGLDLARIRAKGHALGLLKGDETDDAAVADLIFQPGFSTADTLTELAGRGVGMDVVRSEAQALGGRVETASTSGQGTRFTIHLPLTLAVTQVVLLAAGGKKHAVPAVLVEQVLQVRPSVQERGAVEAHGQALPLRYLPGLLGDGAARPPVQRSVPVLVLRAGAERLALQVDEVLGNREVVVKNIGPQLARVPGIAGATVLGSGEIVLILNPLLLAQHLAQHPELQVAALPAEIGVAAARAGGTILVVDDSLTVRKVTQRLLEREGYTVLLAKDGVDALEQLRERADGALPDLMLVDIEMPRMDGFDLTRNVRGDARTQHIPIIMITSRSADKHRNYATQLGVNAYFGKPFQESILLGAIAGLLTG
ncbi:hybrid sensor histidine kinase/response regulator [Pseudoduganella chitinolytica]|uniref:histidine kinase n=1 Tax=Pseudoduganella chitinolytica TaxID=34070 RepID=A0ABY8B8V8_9BURK|nr:Hpt domain-containing protein [Pseudoduganella chitinolytica]WEF31192.1 Hpt domain-containing protein [Pseudoduganella chitinolytica]